MLIFRHYADYAAMNSIAHFLLLHCRLYLRYDVLFHYQRHVFY